MTTIPSGCALVTGAGSGIGRAVAQALARSGRKVALVARTVSALESVAEEMRQVMGDEAGVPFPADLTVKGEPARVFQAVTARLGPVAVLVNAAGGADSGPFGSTTPDAFRESLALNLLTATEMTRACWDQMRESGSGEIVNIASTAGLEGFAYATAYTASKHALVGFTRALAREAAPEGVRVNAICPGFVDTPMLERSVDRIAGKTGRSREEARDSLARMNRGGRLLTPGEVADVVLWLLEGRGRDLTGEAVVVDGLPGPWSRDDQPPLPVNPESLGKPSGYSNGMLMQPGRTLFVAGQVAWDREHRIVGGDDFAAQFGAALGNVLEVVREAGGQATSIGRLRIYVSDRRRYTNALSGVGEAYRRHMGRHYPAMALVEVSRLLEEGALVEIEAEAIL